MRDPSPYAGHTVTLRLDAVEIGGQSCDVVDWYERTNNGRTWKDAAENAPTDRRAQSYTVRRGLAGLPDDDEVLFARVDGMGRIIHVTEIQGYTAPSVDPNAPTLVDDRAVGLPCPACTVALVAGDMVATVLLGPGVDEQAREACRNGLDYQGVYAQLHWACRTGDESYQTEA